MILAVTLGILFPHKNVKCIPDYDLYALKM